MSAREKLQNIYFCPREINAFHQARLFNHLIVGEVALEVFLENLLHANRVCVSLHQMTFQKRKPNWSGSIRLVNDIDRKRLSQEVRVLTDASVLTIKSMKKNGTGNVLWGNIPLSIVEYVLLKFRNHQHLKSQLSSKRFIVL